MEGIWLSGLLSVLGVVIIAIVLWDAFETVVVPKSVERRVRISSIYYRIVWRVWDSITAIPRSEGIRQAALSSFGPLSLIFLFITWTTLLITAFAMLHFGVGALEPGLDFGFALYYSGVIFFTLGFGDITPVATSDLGRFFAVAEAGTGFGFLAILIGYVPTLYQNFSKREHFIVMLDSRAGSDPSAGELIKRHIEAGAPECLTTVLRDAERWCAEQLETYLSYPILAYYRSQHDTQSWLTSMTAILDTCAFLLATMPSKEPWQRELKMQAHTTFAMGRHVVVDLAYLLGDPPSGKTLSRMAPNTWSELETLATRINSELERGWQDRLDKLQDEYEPYLIGLARDLHFTLPSWTENPGSQDNWQLSAWDHDGHF
jgi:hypothetical protein